MLRVIGRFACWLCALFVLALAADRAAAQSITIDPATAVEAAASSVNMSHTVGSGSNRLLIVSVAIERETGRVTAITYAGQALTFVGTSVDPTNTARVEVWRLIAPASGTNTVSVTFNGSSSVVIGAISFANVNQTTPIAASQFATGNGTFTASASVASTTDQVVLATIAADDAASTVTPGSGQTSRWNVLNAADVIGAGSTRSGLASSTTMSFALGDSRGWAMGLFAIQPASTGVVTNTNDSGSGSLRAAIDWANLQTGPATVTFAIPGAGPHTINLASALPAITANNVTINGASQSGTQCRDLWAGSGHDLRINVRANTGFDGFQLGGANQTIRGLALIGFANAITTRPGSSNGVIQCNYLGLFADGSSNGNTRGVLVQGASVRIGGLNAGEGNVISASSIVGVVTEQGSTDTAIRGNFFGTDPTGAVGRANASAINNFMGTATWRDITRNLISANNGNAAIVLETDDQISPSDGQIRIQSNVIGTNRAINALLRNTGDGILFPAGSITGVLIGGTAATEGNIITSQDDGIDLRSVTGITIRGNTIGLAQARGISLDNVSNVTIGGNASTQGNTIGGNGTDGISVRNNSSNVIINGNLIRPVATIGGTFANGGHGIALENSSNVTIGDGTATGRNVIAGNGRRAIQGSGTNSAITINGNYIGTDSTGNIAVANGQNTSADTRDAISFDAGGTVNNLAILNNVIGGYSAALIELWTSTSSGVTIQGNNIGVGANGTSQIVSSNIEDLIYLGGGSSHSNILIGGSGAGQGNILAFSSRSGIRLESTGTNLQVIGNTIRNNTRNGIYVVNSIRASLFSNRIYANGMLGIDLGENGVTLNDAGDADAGPNNLLNFPEFTALNFASGGQLSYAFTLDAPAETNGYRIDFYRNSSADPTGFGEGEEWLGFIDTPAHGGGAVAFTGTFAPTAAVSAGALVSATATRKTGASTYAETSEFNQNGTVVNPLVVTNINDAGAGSLRNAIDFANTQAAPSTISFNIPGAGPHTINLTSALPILTANGMVIDGATQPGAQCRDLWLGNGHDLRIQMRRDLATNFPGLRLSGANQTVRGLSITRFSNAVSLEAASTNARIQCNYIGLRPDGINTDSNSQGVAINGASALIGGLNVGDGNVIAGNAGGIRINNGSTDTSVQGNFIGTTAPGTASRVNGTGIRAFAATSSSSTWRDITGNLLSGNTSGAIVVDALAVVTPSTDLIRIQRNIIGFNRDVSALLLNTRSGINFDTGSITNVLIGGNAATQGNLIAGTVDGLAITNAANITIQGNTIARSGGRGIALVNVNGVTIGGTSSMLGNIIGGNTGNGIDVTGGSTGVAILGNTIGSATVTGGTFVNGGHGILLNTASNVQIGDGTAGGRNVIARNGFQAILSGGTVSNLTINGNFIGTDSSGNVALTNASNSGAFTKDAVAFSGGNLSGITISNNVIGGHAGALLEFWDSTATGVTIQGNKLGVGADGAAIIPADGVEPLLFTGGPTRNYSNVLIGGSAPGQGNIIANGRYSGITMESTGSNIQVIGNTIRNNAGFGVTFQSNTSAALVSNRIFNNDLLGIDLEENWITPNDAGDGDAGSNDLLNFPEIIRAVVIGPNELRYNFTLDVPAAASGYRIEFFANAAADPNGFGEGERFLGHVDITHTGSVQTYSGTLTTLEPVSIGDVISATTTRRTGTGAWDITSEFSAVATAEGLAQLAATVTTAVFDPSPGNPYAAPGSDMLITTSVSNVGNGSADADSIFALVTISPDSTFFNDTTPAFGGVVGFASAAPGLSFDPATDLRFSNAAAAPTALAQCTYVPAPGYDPQVRHVCLNPKGALPTGAPQGEFSVQVRVRVN